MLNRVCITGRLAAAPELQYTAKEKAWCRLSVAVDRAWVDTRTGERECDFIPCVFWGGTAQFLSRNFTKGQWIAVSGRLQVNRWEDTEGRRRSEMVLAAEDVSFCGARPAGRSDSSAAEFSQAMPMPGGSGAAAGIHEQMPWPAAGVSGDRLPPVSDFSELYEDDRPPF